MRPITWDNGFRKKDLNQLYLMYSNAFYITDSCLITSLFISIITIKFNYLKIILKNG